MKGKRERGGENKEESDRGAREGGRLGVRVGSGHLLCPPQDSVLTLVTTLGSSLLLFLALSLFLLGPLPLQFFHHFEVLPLLLLLLLWRRIGGGRGLWHCEISLSLKQPVLSPGSYAWVETQRGLGLQGIRGSGEREDSALTYSAVSIFAIQPFGRVHPVRAGGRMGA